jgi:biopolymer transport protein ExbD
MFEDDLQIIQTPRIKHLWDVTNLIDVMAILLIFLLGTTTFTKMGIPLNQPQSANVTSVPPQVLEIDITKSGEVFYARAPISEADLKALVETELSGNPSTTIRINADEGTQTQALFTVLDWCREMGGSKFSFGAKKK